MLRRILHWLGLLGFAVHDSAEPRIADSQRHWGGPANGWQLGVNLADRDLSLAIKNVTPAERSLAITDWAAFYHVQIDAPLSQYGQLLLKSAAAKTPQQISVAPGKFVETDLPLERLFQLERGRRYRVRVTCPAGVTSNEVEVGA